jgi:hypothetical protein
MVASPARSLVGGTALLLALAALSATALPAAAEETLRGRFRVELEPVAALKPGDPYPLPADTARRYALEEASRVFSGMIYGWSFDYDVGERARGLEERFDLIPLGAIPFGDPRMEATDAETEGAFFFLWAEYRMDEMQKRAYSVLREGAAKNAQGTGSAPISAGKDGRSAALDDAARQAVRSLLRGSERNRPKEARGTVVLVEVPRIWVDAGRFQCAARFRVAVKEIVPYRYF